MKVKRGAQIAIALLICTTGSHARASENGTSLYLLGTGGPEAAILPPVPGIYFGNTIYYYSGSVSGGKQFLIGGNVVADLKGSVTGDFPAVLWVPTTNFLGGTVAVGGIFPFGWPSADVSAFLSGPLGNQVGVSRSDSKFVVGDPVLTAALGWQFGKFHIETSALLNIPVGDYRVGKLANLAFHRWALDSSFAVSWLDDKTGWDLSSKAGFTFNGTNNATDYKTGTEFHVEGALEKTFAKVFSLGAQFYYFDQLTGDSGAGAKLGSFEGRVLGVGGTAAYNFVLGSKPATLRLHGAQEFDAVNRLEGHSIWLDFSIPLQMSIPAAAPSQTAAL